MLKQSRICLAVISAGLLITTDLRAQTPSLTIVPNRITNDYLGPITLLISNITPGMAVAVSKYPDFNNNGVIDPFEPMVARWKVTDAGQPGIGGVRNSNVPGDEDGTTNGRIRMVLNFPSDNLVIEKVAGHYLFELSDPQGSFTAVTAPFEVVQRAWPQSVSGQALDSVSGAPFTNAYVVMVNGNDVGGTGTMTDANGNYAVSNAPDGYVLLAVRPGYVSDQGAAQVSLGATSNLIVNLASSPGSYSISGQVTDQNNGKPIAGLFVQCKNSGNLMSMAFTDTNGNYTLAANPGQWKVSLKQDSGFLSKGYVASGSDASLVVSNASVTGINFSFPKATTLICGLVLDNNSNSLPGIIIDGQDSSYNSAARCLSRADGSYCLGLLSGTWTPQASDGTLLASLGLISQFTPSITLTNGQAAYQNIILTHVSTHLKGVVVDNLGQPVSGIGVDANPSSSPGPNSYVKTANDGSFDLGVFGGDWMLQVDCNDAFQFGLVSPSLQLTVTNGVDRTNLTLTLMQSTATITVVATNQQGQTVQVSGYASLTPNGNYNGGCGQPSPNGLQFKVFNGTWSIGLQDNITSQGYDNPGWQNVSVNGHDVTVYFALYPLGQTPSHINLANMNGQLQFFITGSSQLRYRLEYTTNLANPNAWVPLTTNTTGGGVMMYFENIPSGTAGGRFYRTVVTP